MIAAARSSLCRARRLAPSQLTSWPSLCEPSSVFLAASRSGRLHTTALALRLLSTRSSETVARYETGVAPAAAHGGSGTRLRDSVIAGTAAGFGFAAAAAAEGDGTGACPAAQSPFVYPELTAGIQQRMQAQYLLEQYAERVQAELVKIDRRLQDAGGEANVSAKLKYAQEMAALEKQVHKDTQMILYGVKQPGSRDAYLDAYGCARWTLDAIQTLKDYGPILEIGAGKGHWQKAATEAGVDMVAYDDMSAVPRVHRQPVGEVLQGDHRQVSKRQHRHRTLFICYPEGDMALKALKLYRGQHVLYVGEGRGGVNATPAFFDALEAEWECVKVLDLAPFPQNFEKLFVLRRKQPPPRRGWFAFLRRA